MKRIDTASRHIDKFGAGKDGFKNGNAGTGDPATQLDATIFDHYQEELCNVLAAAGIAPNPAQYNQVATAINALIAAGVAAGGKPGFDLPFLAGFKADFTGEDIAVQTYGRVVTSRAIILLGENAALATAATGAALISDITVNGTSVYTTRPQFNAGATALTPGVLNGVLVNVAAGSTIDFRVTQRGSTIRGQGLAFTLRAREA
jgi:hypothetical protein